MPFISKTEGILNSYLLLAVKASALKTLYNLNSKFYARFILEYKKICSDF